MKLDHLQQATQLAKQLTNAKKRYGDVSEANRVEMNFAQAGTPRALFQIVRGSGEDCQFFDPVHEAVLKTCREEIVDLQDRLKALGVEP